LNNLGGRIIRIVHAGGQTKISKAKHWVGCSVLPPWLCLLIATHYISWKKQTADLCILANNHTPIAVRDDSVLYNSFKAVLGETGGNIFHSLTD